MLVSGSFDEHVNIWDVSHCKLDDTIWSCDSVAMHIDCLSNFILFVCLFFVSIYVRNKTKVRSGRCAHSIAAHSDPVTSCQFSPITGHQIVSSSLDGLVRFWDCRYLCQCYKTLYQVKQTNNFVNDRVPVSHVTFTPNERYILATTLDHKLSLWNVDPPQVESIHQPSIENPCTSSSTSSSSSSSSSITTNITSATSSTSSSLDLHVSKVVKTFTGHKNSTFCMSSCLARFSSCGGGGKDLKQYVIAGSEDHSICMWELQSGNLVSELGGHRDVALGVSAHPTEQMFASCGSTNDKCIRIWQNLSRP
jgi:COMPASS component SWD3